MYINIYTESGGEGERERHTHTEQHKTGNDMNMYVMCMHKLRIRPVAKFNEATATTTARL